MNKKLTIPILIFVAIIVSIITTTILMNKKEPELNPGTNQSVINEEVIMYIIIGDQKAKVDLEDNSTVSALKEMLPLKLSMADLNNNEKYVYLDKSLPTNPHSPKHIEAGDVMLFGDNCLVVFYESFDTSYEYSKIGHIDNLPELGSGNIDVTFLAE